MQAMEIYKFVDASDGVATLGFQHIMSDAERSNKSHASLQERI